MKNETEGVWRQTGEKGCQPKKQKAIGTFKKKYILRGLRNCTVHSLLSRMWQEIETRMTD